MRQVQAYQNIQGLVQANDHRGVLNFSAESIRRRICHVNVCACRPKF